MEAKELRIGNIVFDCFGNVSSVDSVGCYNNIRISNANFIKKSLNLSYDDCKGIPLTEEWLLKFDWRGYKYLCINSYFSLDKEVHLYYCRDYTGINILYVHQLQNLYFALTGTELTLNQRIN